MLSLLKSPRSRLLCICIPVLLTSSLVAAQGVPEGWVSRPLEGGGTFYEVSGLPAGSTFKVLAPPPLQVGQSTVAQAFAQVKQKGLQSIDTRGLSGRCDDASERQDTVTQSCRMEGEGRQTMSLQYVMMPLRSGKAHFLLVLSTGDPRSLKKYQDGFGAVMKMEAARWAADAKSDGAGRSSAPAATKAAATSAPGTNTSAFSTFQNSTLPGRLITNSRAGARVIDLRTGVVADLPRSAAYENDNWNAGNGKLAVRWPITSYRPAQSPVAFFNTADWSSAGKISITNDFFAPRLSPNGRYLMVYWLNKAAGFDSWDDAKLTIFDLTTNRIAKQGSRMDGGFRRYSDHAHWLPDGRYMYFVGAQLYVGAVSSKVDQVMLTLPFSGAKYPVMSPDGSKIAFSRAEDRPNSTAVDTHLWVVNADGSNLHRLTAIAPGMAPTFTAVNARWSPDSQWVAGRMDMSDSMALPVFPNPEDSVAPAWEVVGAVGCGVNSVFVLPHTAHNTPIAWPAYNAKHNIKVRLGTGNKWAWLASCDTIDWLP